MFNATGWQLEPAQPSHPQSDLVLPPAATTAHQQGYLLLRRFEFLPSLQRMSVLVCAADAAGVPLPPSAASVEGLVLCAKGSAEAIRSLCLPASLPADFEETLRLLSRRGYYVLACASRYLPQLPLPDVQAARREDLERDLSFLGFLVLSNELKPDSNRLLAELRAADIRSLMITGDSPFTALTVARLAEMVPQAAPCLLGDVLAGSTELRWTDMDTGALVAESPLAQPSAIETVLALTGAGLQALVASDPAASQLQRVTIFARTSPAQKQLICEKLIEQGRYVGMVCRSMFLAVAMLTGFLR
jgi:magnesium-transporting ATPase (P-type)